MIKIFLLLFLPAFSLAGTLTGRVAGVPDGHNHQQVKIRLDSIDAPKKKQPFGSAVKQALSDMVFSQQVTIETSTTDRYGRIVSEVWREGVSSNA